MLSTIAGDTDILMYKVILLGSPYFATELSSSLESATSIEVAEYDGESVDDEALYLYFGSSVEDKNPHYPELSLAELAKQSKIVPVLQDSSNFKAFIPEEIHTINAITVESLNEVTKLKCFILEHFGLIESNRKVFISYKRDDSLALAHQLYDALVAAQYKPFLDSYSIEYGVDFQEYLRQELSDSAVFILLNTPKYEESEFTMEELNICNKLQMGILEIKAPKSKNFEAAKFSKCYRLTTEVNKDVTVDKCIIDEIISMLEDNRLELQAFRVQAIYDQLKINLPDIVEAGDSKSYFSESENATYIPLYHSPKSYDMQGIQEKYSKDSELIGVYNGMYCSNKVRTHIEWLNNLLPVKMLDITK